MKGEDRKTGNGDSLKEPLFYLARHMGKQFLLTENCSSI